MIVYHADKSHYLGLKYGKVLADAIAGRLGREPDPDNSEYHSWAASYDPIAQVLDDPDIPDDVGVSIEYGLKIGRFRIDYLLTGRDGEGTATGVVIELKQWSRDGIAVSPESPHLFSVRGEGGRPSVHPSYQALSYKILLDNYNGTVQDLPVRLHPCAYLFNYQAKGTDVLRSDLFSELLAQSPLYDWSSWEELQKFLARTLRSGDRFDAIITRIDQSEIRPSKALQNAVADMLEGNPAFTLVDSQEAVYRKACGLVEKGLQDGKRRVYLVHGGPGTGKSVIAVNLMANLLRDGIPDHLLRPGIAAVPDNVRKRLPEKGGGHIALYCPYVTKTDAPRKVYESLLAGHSASGKRWHRNMLEGLFLGAGRFKSAVPSPVYAGLIVDEAHRLKATDRFNDNRNGHGNYLEGIMTSAYTTVFFLDDRQQVSTEDAGSSETIRNLAARHGMEVYEDELSTEFRCVGSNAFVDWIDRLLYGPAGQVGRFPRTGYELKIFDDVTEMHDAVIAKDDEAKARARGGGYVTSRVVAGYCWNWVSRNHPGIPDVVIREHGKTYEKYWNLAAETPFAIGESQQEIGCIHTVQGLEFAYVGVIIGPDLRFEQGSVVTDRTKRARTDHTLDARKGSCSAPVDQLIRNTYRVLLTRGQKGCYIYCVDKPLAAFLKTLVE